MKVVPKIRIQAGAFDLASEIDGIVRDRPDIGATVSFTGHCRDEGGRLEALELEHYPGMAEDEIARIGQQAIDRFGLLGLTVVHRFGRMLPGDPIVVVIAAAGHRQAAFDGASFVMDFLKTDAPFWKKEHLKDGGPGEWVSAREQDDHARGRWQ